MGIRAVGTNLKFSAICLFVLRCSRTMLHFIHRAVAEHTVNLLNVPMAWIISACTILEKAAAVMHRLIFGLYNHDGKISAVFRTILLLL